MSDEAPMAAGLDAFARHSQDIAFFRALAGIAELGATQALAVDELVQRFGSHAMCLAHLTAFRLHAIRTMESWESTLATDAIQKGISLWPVSAADIRAASQHLQAPTNTLSPGNEP